MTALRHFIFYSFLAFIADRVCEGKPIFKFRRPRQSFGPSQTILIPHDPGQPCPIVVAPVDITGGGYFGRPVQTGTWWQGYGPKTGMFSGGLGGNFGLMHNVGFDVNAGHRVVPDYSKDCNNQQPQPNPQQVQQNPRPTTPTSWKPFSGTKNSGKKPT